MTETSTEKLNPLQQTANIVAENIRKYGDQNETALGASSAFDITMALIHAQERYRLAEFRATNNPSDINQQLLKSAQENLNNSSRNLEDANAIFQSKKITSFEEVSQTTLKAYEMASQNGSNASEFHQAVVQLTGQIRII